MSCDDMSAFPARPPETNPDLSRDPPPAMNERTPEHRHRRTNPPNRLDANAIRLLEALPPTVRLTHLRGQYPRVLNRIAGAWNDVEGFNALIDSLLIMDRDNLKL